MYCLKNINLFLIELKLTSSNFGISSKSDIIIQSLSSALSNPNLI